MPMAHHRTLPHKETTLAQHLFDLSGCLPIEVNAGNEIAAQQIGQHSGIKLIGPEVAIRKPTVECFARHPSLTSGR